MNRLPLYTGAIGLIMLASAMAQTNLSIPDSGWRLWLDREAAWENDSLYLPGELDLSKLPLNPPTGGWDVLANTQGIEITLPATVEQHFWGATGLREYKDAYYFEGEDPQVKDGSYRGVSWWWREIDLPQDFQGKQAQLYIRGARLRAEVYWNRQLVGYHIINETAFTCDVSMAVRPGEKNLLAIRITNPGGRLDWLDTQLMSWGKYRFHASHGFGGLDRGMILRAHDPAFIDDLWALNTPEARAIRAHARIVNRSHRALSGKVRFAIIDPDQPGQICASEELAVSVPPDGEIAAEREIACPDAALWSLESPRLYRLQAAIEFDYSVSVEGPVTRWQDRREVSFGFRWFQAEGVSAYGSAAGVGEKNAVLRLNGKRIRLVSAISWGFWGFNGLWPTPELAEREVYAAQEFGMNCLNFHRNPGKTEVLDAQDRYGLLRYMEPGGGQTAFGEAFTLYANSPADSIDTSGKDGEAKTFAEKYMEEKIIRMIRDQRSHPSLIIYCIQNEIHPDLHNPRIFQVLRRMHAEDPSRIIALKSGIPPRNQAWMQPYDDTVYHDRGDGYSGWWDQHTVGGPGVWRDELYKNPQEFTHRSVNDSEIVVWGEMLGAATPDNHPAAIREIEEKGGKSYDLQDRREVLAAYEQFLDRWGFRGAFASAEDLFRDLGDKCYDFWGRVIETARLAEANDFLVISGWESTAIENHSGLVDNLRGFKGNPELLRKRFAPLRPVIRARSLVVAKGEKVACDLFLLNETGEPAGKELQFSGVNHEGRTVELGRYQLPKFEKDRFVYPLARDLAVGPFPKEGRYKLRLEMAGQPGIFSEEEILVIDPFGSESRAADSPAAPLKIAVLSDSPDFVKALQTLPGISAEEYRPGGKYDLAVVSDRLMYGWRSEVEAEREIQGTEDDELFRTESWGWKNNLEYTFSDLPRGKAKVTLRFAEITLGKAGDRVFDVAINGDTVLHDFDVCAAAGGVNIAVDRVFEVDAPEGVVKITIPKRTVNYAKFSAIKVEAGKKVIALDCGAKKPYKDKTGLVWEVYRARVNLNEDLLKKTKKGLNLLLLPEGEDATLEYAQRLSKAGAFKSAGHVGKTRASWMGSWYFVREHPVFAGLPANQALKSYYQVPVQQTDGVLLEPGPGIEVFAGYGRDHDRNVGAAGFSATLGKGKILFHTIPGLITGVAGEPSGIHPLMAQRVAVNSLRFLGGKR